MLRKRVLMTSFVPLFLDGNEDDDKKQRNAINIYVITIPTTEMVSSIYLTIIKLEQFLIRFISSNYPKAIITSL